MVISRTSLRISFVGGGTDIPAFYRNNLEGGAVISTTIDQYVYVAVNKLLEDKIKVKYSVNEEVERVEDIKNTRVRAVLEEFGVKGGIEIISMATLPSSSGLGGSSAFTVGLLKALHNDNDSEGNLLKIKRGLAEYAYFIEGQKLGEPLGKQDQFASVWGGFNLIEFKKDDELDNIKITPLKVPEDFKDYLLFFYIGNGHKASEILKTYNFEGLGEMLGLVHLFHKKLLEGDFEALGTILHKSWGIKRDLSSEVSNNDLDEFYLKALGSGAWGGKLMGAGGGGFFMFIAPPEKHDAIREAVGLKEVKFNFTNEGSKIIYAD